LEAGSIGIHQGTVRAFIGQPSKMPSKPPRAAVLRSVIPLDRMSDLHMAERRLFRFGVFHVPV
jgi:hypothetical protein